MSESDAGSQVRSNGDKPWKESHTSLGKVLQSARVADEFKARDIVILNVAGLSSFADYFLICSARSSRQVQGIADNLETALRRLGIRPLGVEGRTEGHWVLMDFGDVIIHVFYDPVRHFYDLESLWSDAERIDWDSVPGGPEVIAEIDRNQDSP